MNDMSGTPSRTRLSIFDSTASPVRRRSLLHKPQKVDEIANDDDAERVKRRTAVELERRLSSFVSTSSNSPAASREQIGKLREHFDLCLKLFTQNKINSRNVWSIHIIDYMRSLVHSSEDTRSMLQMASTSLDIGAKVYGLRVDDVYNDTLKLAKALAQVNNKDRPDGEDVEVEEDEFVDKPVEKPKRKKRNFELDSTKRITIAENPDKLNGPVQKYNGLYSAQSSTDDNINILNLNLLKTPGHQFELLVRSRASNFLWLTETNRGETERNPQTIRMKLDKLPTTCICPQFKGFATDICDANQEEVNLLQDTVYHNDNGIPIPDLDLENNDPNNDDIVTDDYVEDVEMVGEHGNVETIYVTDMKPRDEPDSSNLEYSYRRPPVINEEFNFAGVWAGPAHWKLKSLRQTTSNVTSMAQLSKNTTKRTKREKPKELEFGSCNLEDLLNRAGRNENSTKYRLTRKHLINASEHCLLPENLDINADDLFTLNLKKDYKVPIQKTSKPVENLNVSSYVYDNPSDTGYCNKTLLGEGWDGEDVFQEDNIDELPLNEDVDRDDHDSIHDDDLIAAPDMVPQSFLAYARTAKKMDMKRLKTVMWEELTEVDSIEDEDCDERMEVDGEIKPTNLSEIYKKLPHKLSQQMTENLSSPLAFVALLHLANEHDLKLESVIDLSDISIKKC